MSHNIIQDSSGTYYCTKCGVHSEDSLSELCKSTLHEEQLKIETESKKIDIESKKIDIEKRKLHIFFIGIILGIIVFLGFFIIIYIGFEKVAVAIQNGVVIAKSAYEECSKGGWLRLIKSLFHQQI
jgi:uncharacterized membrane protein YvbJ